jgi:hypothetical protein
MLPNEGIITGLAWKERNITRKLSWDSQDLNLATPCYKPKMENLHGMLLICGIKIWFADKQK